MKRIYVLVCTAYVLRRKYKDGAAVVLADVAAAPFREPLTRGEVLIVQCLHNMTQNVHSWRASSPSVQVPLIIQVHAVRHTLYTLSSLPVCKIKYDNLYLVATDNERLTRYRIRLDIIKGIGKF